MRRIFLVAVVLLALFVGLALSSTNRSVIPWVGPEASPAVLQQLEQQLLEAVQHHLAKANLPPKDLPTKVLAAVPAGDKRYRVHMAMGVGEAWFEVWWEGGAWQVRGIPSPH